MNIETRIIEPEPVSPPPPAKEIVLTLTPEEALKLRALVFNGRTYRERLEEALSDESVYFGPTIFEGLSEFLDNLRVALVQEGFHTI